MCRVPAAVAGVAYLGPISLLRSDAPSDADEAFTSENWIVSLLACLDSCMWFSLKFYYRYQVRIYQVKKEDLLGRDLKTANAFANGKKRKKSKPLARRKAVV